MVERKRLGELPCGVPSQPLASISGLVKLDSQDTLAAVYASINLVYNRNPLTFRFSPESPKNAQHIRADQQCFCIHVIMSHDSSRRRGIVILHLHRGSQRWPIGLVCQSVSGFPRLRAVVDIFRVALLSFHKWRERVCHKHVVHVRRSDCVTNTCLSFVC